MLAVKSKSCTEFDFGPNSIVVDEKGVIRYVQPFGADWSQVSKSLEKLVAAKGKP
jgi:hypothetical protein